MLLATVFVGGIAFVAWDPDSEVRAVERREREHAAAVERLRPQLVRRVAAVRAAIAAAPDVDGAGEYAWTFAKHTRCGNDPRRGAEEHVLIAPGGESLWWFGNGGPEVARYLDRGRVRAVSTDAIEVDWELAHATPHLNLMDELEADDRLLDDVLVRIRDERQSFLVPACRVGVVAAGHARGGWDLAGFAPRLGGWTSSYARWLASGSKAGGAVADSARKDGERAAWPASEDDDDQNVPWDRTPVPWRDVVLGLDRSARGRRVEDPVRLRDLPGEAGFWNWVRGRSVYGTTWRSSYEAPVGFEDGVRSGMVAFLVGSLDSARVVSVAARTCRIDVIEFHRRESQSDAAPAEREFRWYAQPRR